MRLLCKMSVFYMGHNLKVPVKTKPVNFAAQLYCQSFLHIPNSKSRVLCPNPDNLLAPILMDQAYRASSSNRHTTTWQTHQPKKPQLYRSKVAGKKLSESVPAFTRRFLALSTNSGNHFCASPTKIAVDRAIQRWPAAPKAAPTSWFKVFSLLASGITTPWFFAP